MRMRVVQSVVTVVDRTVRQMWHVLQASYGGPSERMAGANVIVGVAINSNREERGRKFGMTHFVNPKAVDVDIVAHGVASSDSTADLTPNYIGNTTAMRQARETHHRGLGISIIIGVPRRVRKLRPVHPARHWANWRGTAFGGGKRRIDFPKIGVGTKVVEAAGSPTTRYAPIPPRGSVDAFE